MRIADCGLRIASCVWLVWASATSAQDSPSPTESPAGVVEPTATSTPAATRSVRISFVPPPLDGTISLGIYDLNGKLVRLLHQQASVEEFTIGADALQTKWDGKDDD